MRRIELSASQVIASVLATVTGALAASYLGVAGTLVGAAVASLAATIGTAVYRHYLARTQERLRVAATAIAPAAGRTMHARQAAAAATARAGTRARASVPARREAGPGAAHPGPGAGDTASRDTAGQDTAAGASAPGGQGATPGAGAAGPGTQPGRIEVVLGEIRMGGDGTGQSWVPQPWGPDPGQARVRVPDQPGAEPTGDAPTAGDRAAVPGGDGSWLGRFGRTRWRALVALAAGIFVVTMAVITLMEAAAGRPLEALLWHRHASGTTVGNLVSGRPGTAQQAPQPSRQQPGSSGSPAPTATPSSVPSPSPSPSQPVTPSPSLPAPPPSQSPAPTTSATPTTSPAP